jgi:hypothetical protein
MSEPLLSDAERRSLTWRKIARYIEARTQELRVNNDALSLDERRTAALRGGIAELKNLLALGEDPTTGEAP